MKPLHYLKAEHLLKQAKASLIQYLADVPFLDLVEITEPKSRSLGAHQPDILVKIRIARTELQLLVEVQNSGEPGNVRRVAQGFMEIQKHQFEALVRAQSSVLYPLDESTAGLIRTQFVFAAPYIPPAAAALCKQFKLSYFDFEGNCRLLFDQTYISSTNSRPTSKTAPKNSLYTRKSQSILRVLLEHPGRTWMTAALAEEAEVSTGQVSITRKLLADHEWIHNTPHGFELTEPFTLLQDWVLHYKNTATRNTNHDYYSLKGFAEVEAQVAEASAQLGIRCALTGPAGAARLASYARYNRIEVYVEREVEAFAASLGLRPVDSGANVRLVVPRDLDVMYNAQFYEGIPVACATQLYLDLANSGGRNAEAADYLLEQYIQPNWTQAAQNTGRLRP